MGCYIWYSEEGPRRAAAPPSPLLAVPNVTAHTSIASVAITVLLYDGPLLCGFNVAIKGLKGWQLIVQSIQRDAFTKERDCDDCVEWDVASGDEQNGSID